MSKKVKSPKTNLCVPRNLKLEPEEKVAVSFQYLTKNGEHNFDHFKKNKSEGLQTATKLLEFLKRLTTKTMTEILGYSKKNDCGFETITAEQLKFNPDGYTLGNDAKVSIFRFGNGDHFRLLGFFDVASSVLNIIGFDFDYSAYSHG